MENNEQSGNGGIRALGRFVIRWRWLILLVSIAAALAAGSGGQYLTFNNDYHIFFDEDNPHVLAFDGLQEKYTKDDNVFIVIQPEDGEVFSSKTLAAVEDLEEMAWQTPFSTRVDALSNFQHTRAEGDDMYVESLASNAAEKTGAEVKAIRDIALNEPLLVDRLVNRAGNVTAVNITVHLPADSMEAPMVVMAHAREMVKRWEAEHPGYKTYLSGIVMMNGAFAEGSMNDMATLVPIMFLIILFMVLLTTRNIAGLITAFMVLFLSIMTAMGLAGWAGVQLTGPSSTAPTMIMTLAIADSIHLLITLFQSMRRGMAKRDAIIESLRLNFMPVFITSVTTIIGFLTLNFVEGEPFHDLGNITATGVAAAFFYSIFTLPALMAILPVKVKAGKMEQKQAQFVDRLADFVISNRKPVLWISVVTVLVLSGMALRNELNNEFVKFFDKSVQFRTDTDFISENLTGIYTIEYSLGAGDADGISDPEYLRTLDAFEQWFKEQDHVMHVNTFSEVMKRVNESMHGDDPAYYQVPGAKDEAAQYLLLYEMSLPYGLDLNNQINVDKSETRFTVTLDNVSTNEMLALTRQAEQWLTDNAPSHMFSHGISTAIMFSHITRTNMDAMLKSGFGALVLISFILVFAFRSTRYGLVSIVPNMTPIAVGFGLWAIGNGQINMALAVVLGMTLGIVVDDTVHLLAKYIRARRELGKSAEDAVRYAFATVGRAVIVNTIILVAGFSVLMQSSFGLNSDMGKLTAITIAAALVLDLLLLPAILLAVDRGPARGKTVEQVPGQATRS